MVNKLRELLLPEGLDVNVDITDVVHTYYVFPANLKERCPIDWYVLRYTDEMCEEEMLDVVEWITLDYVKYK